MPVDFARSTLGDERYTSMLDNYNNKGVIDDEDLAALETSLGDGRSYLVMSRLETEGKSKRSGENTDSSGAVLNIYYLSLRAVSASFKVWDIRTRKLVWSGSLGDDATSTNSYDQDPPPEPVDRGLLGGLLDALLSSEDEGERPEYVYPPIPSYTWVIGNLFEKFAKALPHD